MTWRPYLDLQIVQSRRFSERGIPRYATELSRSLVRADAPLAALALNPHLPFPRRLPPELGRSPQLTWNTASALRRAIDDGPTLYHLLAPYEPSDLESSWLPGNLISGAIPLAVSVYDLIPELMGLFARRTRAERFYRIRSRLLSRADLLLAISEQTRGDVIEHVGIDPERVVVVGAGGSEFFHPARPDETPVALLRAQLPAITRPFVLTVSAWEVRKNTELLIDAFASLPVATRGSLQLVVVCKLPPEGFARWNNHARSVGLGPDDVIFTGFVPDPALRALYQQAELFVYPSRYEGFGLPVLEAARCGAPAIVADAPGLQEVLEWQPATFDPDDADALAELIERGVIDAPFRSRLLEVSAHTAHRHTWERVAERTVAGYARLDRPTRSRRRPASASRRRLALVGPFPPARSGVARYNSEVAAHLAERCELDCYVDACDWVHDDVLHEAPPARVQAVGPRRPPGAGGRWLPARALGLRIDAARYDGIIYALGNSWFHHDTLSSARRFPGIAWFHDVDLTGLYITYAHRLLERDPTEAVELFARVLTRYGRRAPEVTVTAADRRWATYDPYREAGIRFALELARDARASIVSSRHAQALLELDAGPAHLLAPVEVLPLAAPAPRPERGRAAEPPVVMAVGRQDANAKQPDTLLEAIAIVARSRPVRLVIVGEIRPELRAALARRVAELGLTTTAEITGYLPEDEYRRRLGAAGCAVQLRDPSAVGGGSAAVGDALAAGVAVLTNIPSCAELPDGTVHLVEPGVEPLALAREILHVLGDDEYRRRLVEVGLRYARSWSFEQVADRILEIVGATESDRWREQRSA